MQVCLERPLTIRLLKGSAETSAVKGAAWAKWLCMCDPVRSHRDHTTLSFSSCPTEVTATWASWGRRQAGRLHAGNSWSPFFKSPAFVSQRQLQWSECCICPDRMLVFYCIYILDSPAGGTFLPGLV
ncbi:hypothetical protein DPEC_G00278070 [Dallia pectoralis]|uniref:Uncharacterized protein n=1 Tax=Dallia pectoralis TaxID=75939 RepID=A0ACC2FLY2_DALPE|nr:hypothetical protein DPEC_G00278070 [Dallia pectoralis]